MIGADNVLAKGDGRTIKHGQLPLRQENVGNVGARWDGENVGNVGAMAEQYGMGKCRKCRSNGGAIWDGKMLEMSEQWQSKMGWENVGNVGAKSEQDGLGKRRSRVGARWERKWYMTVTPP